MNPQQSIDGALKLIHPKRQSFDIITVTDFAGAYNLKRRFAIQAGTSILFNYANVIRNRSMKNPLSIQDDFNFMDPGVQLAYWIDSLLHNCRGALETLGHIINYVYRLGIDEKDVSFFKSLKKSIKEDAGIHSILSDISIDAWFTIINRLRNRSYHTVLNTFVPKVGYGAPNLQFTIRFPINPTEGNLTHETPILYKCKMARMELAEFANFITVRLEEYLSQVDSIIIDDCIDISNGLSPRSKSNPPKLEISHMKLYSWRSLIDIDDMVHSNVGEEEDLE